jgi:hypothetical protein
MNTRLNISQWLKAQTENKREEIFKNTGVRYSTLEELPYWDPTRMINLDIMHNMILGALKDHAETKLRISERSWKYQKGKTNTSDSEASENESEHELFYSYTENEIDARAARILLREAADDIRNLPMKRVSKNPIASSSTSQHTPSQRQRIAMIPTSNLTERYHDDLDYVPISTDNPSSEYNLDPQETLSWSKFSPELLGELQDLINETIIPSDWTRVPKNIGEASHGSLKAAEWLLLYKLYIPMLMIINQSGSNPFPDDIINNTLHLISALNISTSWTTNSQSCSDFTRHWTKYRQISKKMFPDIDSKPNHDTLSRTSS